MRIQIAVLLSCILPIAAAQSTTEDKKDARYNAVLWSQVSPEYAVTVRQTFQLARMQLAAALANENHTADERQAAAADYQEKPPAIILDVDETVLDNSAYNARNTQDGRNFNPETWNAWVNEAIAPPIPGAVDFIKHAQEKGVAVFLVTNRRDENRAGTLKNLQAVGLQTADEKLLLRNDNDNRGGDKVSRRAMVAKDYRILLLIGDNIADLCDGTQDKSGEEARAIAARKQERFGSGWVMLPNPVYGGWERKGDGLRTQRVSRPPTSTTSNSTPVAKEKAIVRRLQPSVSVPVPAVNPTSTPTEWTVLQPTQNTVFVTQPFCQKTRQCNCACCRCRVPRRRFNSRR
jgi:acid phosphatase